LKSKDQSTLDWINQAGNNICSMLFRQEHRNREDTTVVLSLAVANLGFNLTEFITEANRKNGTQVTWKAKEEGKIFTIALEESSMRVSIESKS